MSKKNMGSGIDDFLREEGILEESQSQAVREVVAWQLAEAMKEKNISKNKMATLLKTSRSQVDRILNPRNDITLGSLQRAAAMWWVAVLTDRTRVAGDLSGETNRNLIRPSKQLCGHQI